MDSVKRVLINASPLITLCRSQLHVLLSQVFDAIYVIPLYTSPLQSYKSVAYKHYDSRFFDNFQRGFLGSGT